LAVVLSLVVFVVVSLLAFFVALLFVDGVAWPVVIGIFCGLAAAVVLNATDVMARRSRRDSTGDRDNQRENGGVP
jgi:membrane protein implicated in regulation of membrane protease activity